MPDNSPHIVILDDEALVAEQARAALVSYGYSMVTVVYSGKEARLLFQTTKVDILITDIVLGNNQFGYELAAELRKQYSFILVYITGYNGMMLEKTHPTFPEGYLVKPFLDSQVNATITSLWKSRQLGRSTETLGLTPRELQILRLLSEGKSSIDIGLLLNVSAHTVNTHRRNIMSKLNVANEREMLTKCYRLGVLT